MSFNEREKTYDLHGIDTTEATAIILNALFEFVNSNSLHHIYFITGKGMQAISTTLLNLLDQEGFTYKKDNSSWTYTVYKNLKNDDTEEEYFELSLRDFKN